MKWITAVAIVGAGLIVCSAAAQDDGDRRQQARSLAASGKLIEALSVYDELRSSGSGDVTLYAEARRTAVAAHDLRRAAVYGERRLKVDPNDYDTRSFIPLAYRLAGDEADAQRSREEFLSYWKASSDPNVRAKPFLLVDRFQTGGWTVYALECMEIAGDYGVGYMFDVWGPKAPPLPPDEVVANHRERIVLEHNRLDQKILSELKHEDADASNARRPVRQRARGPEVVRR
jgi:tetratricopeptide (TPR) repeat protein